KKSALSTLSRARRSSPISNLNHNQLITNKQIAVSSSLSTTLKRNCAQNVVSTVEIVMSYIPYDDFVNYPQCRYQSNSVQHT
ncbi:unnamed protein product, partial [Rotaria magnacalcarata]